MTPDLLCFTQVARENPRERFNSLMGLLYRPEGLLESFRRLPSKKAPGVDGIRKEEYAKDLINNIGELSNKLRRMGYRPKPSRRVYIPKQSGKGRRPLGIPSFECRIVQDRLSQILQAIWEPEFRDCSFGFRPKRSAHDALRRVAEIATNEGTQWVVEADIKGFFNNVTHKHTIRFLEHRIADKNIIRLIKRFLRAGIMEDGQIQSSTMGYPQGGLISPVISNIYLHYVLDWWFEGRVAKQCQGKAYLVRYADDFIACFELESDARRFVDQLEQRLLDFDLEIEKSKSSLLRFGSNATRMCSNENRKKPETFNFLGFTHYCTESRSGRFMVGRRTERSRMIKKLKEVGYKLKGLRVEGGKRMINYACRHLEGHIQYYGVSGNSRSLRQYSYHVMRHLFRWLNRRSQKRSFTWSEYRQMLLKGLLPKVRIVHNLYPKPKWMT